MWHHKLLHRGGSLGAQLLADIGSGSNVGITALSQDLTINGQTVSPTFRYEAKNATTGLWTATVGDNLTGAGSGGLVGLDTPMLDDAEAVNGQGTRYWGPGTLQQVGLRDAVYETVFRLPETATASESIFATRTSSKGVHIRRNSSANSIQFYMSGTTSARNLVTGTLTPGAWYHLLCVYDASGSSITYVDADAGGSTSGNIGSVDDDSGPYLNFVSGGSIQIAYFAAWYGLDMLDTHLQAAVAEERFARLNGSYASGWAAWPTQANLRNSVATLEKRGASGGQKLFTVGACWPRLERRPDKHLRYATGFLCESQHTNLITYSEQLDDAAWTKTRSTIDSNSGDAPDGTATMDTIVEDGTASDTHFIEQTFTQSAASHTFQAVVEAIGRSWIQLELDSATDGAASAYFDLTSGAIGTQVGNDRADARYLGAGLYMVSLTDTRATAESCSARIYASDGNNGRSYSGASIGAVRVWGTQVTATAYPVSYIKTAGATVTRLSDLMLYGSLSLPAKGTLAVDVLDNSSISGSYGWVNAQKDGSNFARLYGSNRNSVGYIYESGILQALIQGTLVRSADAWAEHRLTYDTDDVRLYKDGAQLTTDTSASMPAGLADFYVGSIATGSQANALVRARLYSKPTIANVTDFGDIMAKASGYISSTASTSCSTSYTNVAGTFTAVNLSEFTLSAAGVFTYTGVDTKRFLVVASCSGAKTLGGSAELTTAVEKNGAEVVSSAVERTVDSSNTGAWSIVADVELATNDTVNIAIKVDTGTPTIDMSTMSIALFEVS